jgi:hypothetical protein
MSGGVFQLRWTLSPEVGNLASQWCRGGLELRRRYLATVPRCLNYSLTSLRRGSTLVEFSGIGTLVTGCPVESWWNDPVLTLCLADHVGAITGPQWSNGEGTCGLLAP